MLYLALVLAVAAPFLLQLLLRRMVDLELRLYLASLAAAALLTVVFFFGIALDNPWHLTFSVAAAALTALIASFGIMEFFVLRLLANFRLGAIVRVTYYEALLHPFTLIILTLALFLVSYVLYSLPYYTLSEDFKMYRDVASQTVFFATLAIMVFAASKVIDEEIENRTMLTLMSKPISRWEVVLGKYLGVLAIVFITIFALGLATTAASYLRYYEDLRLDINSAAVSYDKTELPNLLWANIRGTLALLPLFTLQFLQVATLAAIAVAISTRYPLALNVTAIVLLYLGAHLTRFIPGLPLHQPWHFLANGSASLLPFLANFDLDVRLIYGQTTVGNEFISRDTPTYATIWYYVSLTGVYALLYITAALGLATTLFRTRELT